MNKNIIYILLALVLAGAFASCKEQEVEPYKNPFFHIHVDNRSTVEVLSNRKDTVDYKVYLSAELQFDPIDVQYEVKVGNGLVAGRDYELLTQGTTLNFPSGIFERPIRIAWKEAALDATKDNTITIRLLSNSKNYTLGLPGPDGLQRQLVITKK